MKSDEIILIINKNTYQIKPNNIESINKISYTDKQQLIELLNNINKSKSLQPISPLTTSTKISNSSSNIQTAKRSNIISAENIDSGDKDALIHKLIMEEKHNQKPGLTKKSLYKFIGIFSCLIILMILIF